MVDKVGQALIRLIDSVSEAGSAEDRALAAHRVVAAIGSGGLVREKVVAARRDAVNELRVQGASLGDVATLLGVARGTAQQISEGRGAQRVVLGRGRVSAR